MVNLIKEHFILFIFMQIKKADPAEQIRNKGFYIKEGTIIRGYTFNKCIGSGGFAGVYLVTSNKFNKTFVAKIILPKDENIQRAWESFDSEVSSLLKLDYPHIIRLYDHFSVNNFFFLILEYCSRGSLYDEVSDCGPLRAMRLITVVKQLISAVYNAHKNNVAHRDIKPHNILFDDFGRVKLADFGISVCNSTNESINNFPCSPAFGAPEVLRKEPYDAFKADVWSLGITIYYAATGELPFKHRTISEMVNEMKLVGINLQRTMMPPQVYDLLKKMIVYDPNQRISIETAYDIFCVQQKDAVSKASSSITKFPSLKLPLLQEEGSIGFNTGITLPPGSKTERIQPEKALSVLIKRRIPYEPRHFSRPVIKNIMPIV